MLLSREKHKVEHAYDYSMIENTVVVEWAYPSAVVPRTPFVDWASLSPFAKGEPYSFASLEGRPFDKPKLNQSPAYPAQGVTEHSSYVWPHWRVLIFQKLLDSLAYLL